MFTIEFWVLIDDLFCRLHPAFSLEHNNFFILESDKKAELFKNGGLELKIKDWDRVGKNDDLGSAFIPATTLYNVAGDETFEYKIDPPKGRSDEAGFITIRCRPATLGDKEDYKRYKNPFRYVKAVSSLEVSITSHDLVSMVYI